MSRPRNTHLTDTHRKILRLAGTLLSEGSPLTLENLVMGLGLAGKTSLIPTLQVMERNGFIEISGGGVRGRRCLIKLTGKSEEVIGFRGIPLLGVIPAGPLTEAIENCDTFVAWDEVIPYSQGDFLLEVDGDSMTGDGILTGDKVLIRPNTEIKPGEIAAVRVGNDSLVTLKHVHIDTAKRIVVLRASNSIYEEIVISDEEVTILGAFRGLIRVP